MKNKKLLSCLVAALMLVALVGVLGGCAPKQASDGGSASTESGSAPVGSLQAAHVNGELESTDDYSNKFCLSCHPRAAIDEANENYSGIEGFNPHKAHLAAGDCTTCHSIDGTSTLTCNSCHDAPLPEGWESAERGAGPLHSLKDKAS